MIYFGCAIVLAVIIIVCIRIINTNKDRKTRELYNRLKEETKDSASLSGTTLYLRKRDPKLRELITIKEFMGSDGGKIEKSGVFKRMYYAGSQVFEIKLTEELNKQAQGSYIEKYLNGQTIEVIDYAGPRAIASLKYPLPFGASDIDRIEWEGKISSKVDQYTLFSGRTYNECLSILSWICGQNDKPVFTE